MKTVNVKVTELLEKVQANRNTHFATFEKACGAYRERAIAELDASLAQAKKGGKITRFISLPEPENHTDDYDRVIAMLQMSQDKIIEISEHDFSTYVMDNWAWSAAFARNTMSYVG